MLRRPVKQDKQYSYTDIDVESAGDRRMDVSSAYGSSSSSTIAFKLTGLLKKQWQSFTDTNFAICQEATEFVVEHKPEFDKEKLKLIQLSTFIENDITCGTVTAIKARSQYDGPLLNDQTFSPDWNHDARKINQLVSELNRQIARENLLSGGSTLSLASFTSCFPGGGSMTRGGGERGDSNGDIGGMRPMPVEVSRETAIAFARNPRLFLQSPLHMALLGVLCFALLGLLATFSLLFATISSGMFLVIFVVTALYHVYVRRTAVLEWLEECSVQVRRSSAPALQEATRLVGEWSENLSDRAKGSFHSVTATQGSVDSGTSSGSDVLGTDFGEGRDSQQHAGSSSTSP